MGKQQNNGKGSLTNKQRSKIKPLHELSEEETAHLRRSGRYIPPVKLTRWQELKSLFASIPDSVKNVLSFKTLGQAVNASVLIGAITFIAGEQGRRDAQVYQAWQVITAAHGQSGSGGRIQALEFLNSTPRRIPWLWMHWERESLVGLEAPKAYLVRSRKDIFKIRGIQLPKADLSRANLQEAYLRNANLQGAYLYNANLQGAHLYNANLQKADLLNANLQGADLWNANLQGADLYNANLQRAYLRNANLQGAYLSNANLLEVRKLETAKLQKAQYTDKSTSPETCNFYFNKASCPTIFPPNFDPKAAGMVLLK